MGQENFPPHEESTQSNIESSRRLSQTQIGKGIHKNKSPSKFSAYQKNSFVNNSNSKTQIQKISPMKYLQPDNTMEL